MCFILMNKEFKGFKRLFKKFDHLNKQFIKQYHLWFEIICIHAKKKSRETVLRK